MGEFLYGRIVKALTIISSTIDTNRARHSLPDIPDGIPLRKRIIGVQHITRKTSDPGLAADGRRHRVVRTDLTLFHQSSRESGAEDSLVNEVFVQAQFAARMQRRHAGAGAGAAGGTVDRSRPRRGLVPIEFAR